MQEELIPRMSIAKKVEVLLQVGSSSLSFKDSSRAIGGSSLAKITFQCENSPGTSFRVTWFCHALPAKKKKTYIIEKVEMW